MVHREMNRENVEVPGSRSRKKPLTRWQFAKTVVMQWFEDQPFQLASSLSYYTLFSLAPLLIIAIAVAGLVFGREAAQNQVVETLRGMIGQDSARAIQDMIQNASNQPKTGVVSAVVGVVALMFGAGALSASCRHPSIRSGALRQKQGKVCGALSAHGS